MQEFSDAIEKLEDDHDKVEALFERIKEATEKEKLDLGLEVANLVKIHMLLEEEFLYPALRGRGHDDKLTEGLVEHDAGKVLINDLLSPATDRDAFPAKVQVLGEQMTHHHKEEEESDGVFSMAREAGIDLAAMLDQMTARERELKTELKSSDLPEAEMNYVEISASQ